MLSKANDANYVGATLAAWVSRYLEIDESSDTTGPGEQPALAAGEVLVTELDKKFLRGMFSDSHRLIADEPEKYGGSNLGPTPYDLLLMSLGACTSMTLRMYANRKKMAVYDIEVKLVHERVHAEDCVECKDYIDRITRSISFKGDLNDEQQASLMAIADKCPVHRTLENNPKIVTELV